MACAPCLCNQTRLYNFASPPLSASDSATHLAFGRKPNVSFFAFSAEFFRLPNFRCTSSKDIFYFNSQGSFDPFDGCSSVKDRFLQPEVRKFAFPHYCLSNDFELTEANSRSGYEPPDVAARCSSVSCPVLERRSPSRRKESQGVARQIFGLNWA